MTEPRTPTAPAEPLSAVILPEMSDLPQSLRPGPDAAPAAHVTMPDISTSGVLDRLRPLLAHATLFAAGLGGGLAVALGSSLALHSLGTRADRQLASARIEIPAQPPEPLDVEIRKAKAELDAALNPRNGS